MPLGNLLLPVARQQDFAVPAVELYYHLTLSRNPGHINTLNCRLSPHLLLPVAHDQDIAGLQVAVDDPVLLQVAEAVEQLPHDALHGGRFQRLQRLGAVPPQQLVQVVLCVVKG